MWLGLPIVRARASNGRELLIGIDTGASRSYLTDKGERKLGQPGAKTFFVGNTAITLQDVPIEPSPRDNRVLDGVLGNDAFKTASVRLNMPRRCAVVLPEPER